MKDLLISARRIKTELTIMAACLMAAVLVNIGCIIAYHTPWYEVFTQVGFTCVVAVIIYIAIVILRLLFAGLKRICRSSANKSA